MAEVTHRSFDLKSWQGLTDVLKVARESHLSPAEYAEFRNLVLQFAQQKGSEPELKKNIESMIQMFTEAGDAETHDVEVAEVKPVHVNEKIVEVSKPHAVPQGGGRRTVPVFTSPQSTDTVSDMEIPKEEPVLVRPATVASVEHEDEAPSEEPPQVEEELRTPVTVPEVRAVEETLKSIEEHRARILEIKRRVNSLVGNPVTLMDHGNHIGREYMTALLSALKATSPGSSQNIEGAMAGLEKAFAKILELGPEASSTERAEMNVPQREATTQEIVQDETRPVITESVPEVVKETPVPESAVETIELEPDAQVPDTEVLPVLEPVVAEEEPAIEPDTHPDAQPLEVPQEPQGSQEQIVPETNTNRWGEAGGDADVRSQIKALRETLQARETVSETRSEAPRARRPLIPSLIDMEDEPLPSVTDNERTEAPLSNEDRDDREAEELSTKALTNRPLSSMTGITLGTPQGELATQEVTGVLTELLHDWSIFASSGIFGMGPSGMDHPLYERLSRLPMGEVLAGRFENADMKMVRNIKEYVNAWRHEQGIAYNPSETFEHYLRRVAQRILKRQNCIKTV